MKEVKTEKIPIKMWLTDIEDNTMEQAQNLANLPFAFMHIAIMPDSHLGYGMPIGGVLATRNVVIPNAVGVDIGCGMRAVKTSLKDISSETIKKIMGHIRETVPVGFKHQEKSYENHMPMYDFSDSDESNHLKIVNQEYNSATKQVGTLGGGNHFIEIQKGSDGFIWIMLHSGSRNIGYKVAKHYNEVAIDLNKKMYTSVPEKWELAFLPLDSKEGQAYMAEMQYCLDFAKANRALMMSNVKEGFAKHCGALVIIFDEDIDIHHNYAAVEKHFGKEVVIHRKGATSAQQDQVGIIPGSQGTSSYIVKGKGNMFSFKSCSHGAGRKMGRIVARRTLSLKKEVKMLEDKGIIHSIRSQKELDEAPSAYKDIEEVMDNQKDLVDIVVKLEPLAVIKG